MMADINSLDGNTTIWGLEWDTQVCPLGDGQIQGTLGGTVAHKTLLPPPGTLQGAHTLAPAAAMWNNAGVM